MHYVSIGAAFSLNPTKESPMMVKETKRVFEAAN
jgi:hypothetical protein